MEQIEAWMNLREPLLKEKKFGESIEGVEELLRRHADFEKTVVAQEDRVNALQRNEKVSELCFMTVSVLAACKWISGTDCLKQCCVKPH